MGKLALRDEEHLFDVLMGVHVEAEARLHDVFVESDEVGEVGIPRVEVVVA